MHVCQEPITLMCLVSSKLTIVSIFRALTIRFFGIISYSKFLIATDKYVINIHVFFVFTGTFQGKTKREIKEKPDKKSSIFGMQRTKTWYQNNCTYFTVLFTFS